MGCFLGPPVGAGTPHEGLGVPGTHGQSGRDANAAQGRTREGGLVLQVREDELPAGHEGTEPRSLSPGSAAGMSHLHAAPPFSCPPPPRANEGLQWKSPGAPGRRGRLPR